MRRARVITAMCATLLGGCRSGYSAEFRAEFLSHCLESSGGAVDYCHCVIDHLEENGPSDEDSVTVRDQTAAIRACQDLVADQQELPT
jgi:hypothetical protein